MRKLPSNLHDIRFAQQTWNDILKRNAYLLENVLLFVNALQDVDITGLTTNDLLMMNGSTGKFEKVQWNDIFTTTTTSTTTTT